MQEKNGTVKIVITFLLITTFIVLGIFCVLAYTKEPTEDEIHDYMHEKSGAEYVLPVVNEAAETEVPV